jgi:hypothetical protein
MPNYNGTASGADLDKITGLQATAAEIDNGVFAHPALGNFLFHAEQATSSMAILVNSDSTGNGNDEWVYFFAQWLTTKYPKFTIRYRIWDEGTNAYLAPVSMNTGTTAFFMDLWNFAVAGSAPQYILGLNKITNGIKNICNKTTYPDVSDQINLIISNHGHNAWNDPRPINNVLYHAMFSETVLQHHPYASFMQIRQNPWRDDYLNEPRIRWATDWAHSRGFAVANAWDKFVALGKAANLYADNIHPSQGLGNTGTQLMLNSVTEQLNKKFMPGNSVGFDSLLNLASKNIIPNGNFLTWTDVNLPPDGWTVTGGTCLKDTTVYIDTAKKFSCKVTALGGAACNLKLEVLTTDSDKLEGGWYTMAVRMKVDTVVGNTTNAGRVAFISNTDTPTSPSHPTLNGEWHWRFLSVYLKTTDVYLRSQINLDASTTALEGQFIHIDSVMIVKGKMPYGVGV